MQTIDIIGFLAAFCTTVAYLPQAIKAFKTRKTEDISSLMYVIMLTGLTLWLIYGVLLNNYPIIIANIATILLASSVLILKIKTEKTSKK